MQFFVITIISSVLLEKVSSYNCPPAHVTQPPRSHAAVHNHMCYLFVDSELYWKEARSKCYELGAEMLTITNEKTMSYIRDKLNSRDLNWSRNGVWLGLHRQGGTWKWTTDERVTYSNWADDEPSTFLGIYSMENCGLMRRNDNWQWHDRLCGTLKFHYNYICQFQLNEENNDNEKNVSRKSKEVVDGMQNDAAAPMVTFKDKDQTESPSMSKFPGRNISNTIWAELLNSIHKVPNPDSDYFQSLGRKVYQLVSNHQGSSDQSFTTHSDTALNRPGDKVGKISPAAGAQERDTGYTTILIVVICIGCGILLIVLIVFLVVYRLARQARRKEPEPAITYHNNQYSEPRPAPPPPFRMPAQIPALPPYRPPSMEEGLYFTPTDGSEAYTDINGYAQVNTNCDREKTQTTSPPDPCSCRDPLAEVDGSCSSLASGTALGACGGVESDGSNTDINMPLLPSNQSHSDTGRSRTANGCSCNASQGDYIDMRSVSSNENILQAASSPPKNLVKEQHIYSNPLQEVGDEQNVYSKPSKNVDKENTYSKMSKNVGKVQSLSNAPKDEDKDQHTYSNVDHKDTALENHYEVLP